MSAQHTPGPLPAMPLKLFSVNNTTAILDAGGNEVVGWMGFDDSNRTKAQHKALAAHIVQCVNANYELARDAARYRFLRAQQQPEPPTAHPYLDVRAHDFYKNPPGFTAGSMWGSMHLSGDELDAAVDAALAKAGVQS